MKLIYPNPCRSFDAGSGRVCFWGYASTIEISFFVGINALKRLCPDMGDTETGILQAFDATLTRIHQVADRVYARGGNGTFAYTLAAEDF
jgi:hypothetical protein